MIWLTHATGISGVWAYVKPDMSVARLIDIENAVYEWRLDYLRQLIKERLDEDAT